MTKQEHWYFVSQIIQHNKRNKLLLKTIIVVVLYMYIKTLEAVFFYY